MNNIPKISFCIPLKNNLRYFKRCLNSIKKYADVPYEIVVYIDSDNDGTESFSTVGSQTALSNPTTPPCK